MAYSIKAEKHEVDFLIGLKEIKGECFFSARTLPDGRVELTFLKQVLKTSGIILGVLFFQKKIKIILKEEKNK